MTTFREYLEEREAVRARQAKALARSRAAKFNVEDFLREHAGPEWASVEEHVWSLVANEEVSGHRFFRRDHAIGLGSVVVRFVSQATDPSASPCLFDLVFGCETSGQSAPAEHWKMRAVASEGDIFWTRSDVCTRHAETKADMATLIATKLVEFYDKVERASGRDELFVGGMMTPQRG
jgi:hypothetical protein